MSGFEANNEWGLRDELSALNGAPFVTSDQNHGDASNDCAASSASAGWLVKALGCAAGANPFAHANHNSRTAPAGSGVFWSSLEGETNSLQSMVWMIKPTSKLLFKKKSEIVVCLNCASFSRSGASDSPFGRCLLQID